MTRLVVHIEWRPELDPDVSLAERDGQWAQLLAPLYERAGALGGRVVGWGYRFLVVDFAWDGLYDAVDFLVDAPLAPELASGLCHGEQTVIFDGGRIAMAFGPAVRMAADLAQLARPGEVLVSPDLVADADQRLGTIGEVGTRTGRPNVPAMILSPEEPFRETAIPEPGGVDSPFELMPAQPGRRRPSSRAPESVRMRQVERLAETAEALGADAKGVFPPELSSALRKRDAASLLELAESVRAHDAVDAADRIDAIAQLASGKSGEALRRLRRSKESAPASDPSARCRAALALAVALVSAGRPYEAALEGIFGVARAREGGDARGERACARFLAQLSKTMNDSRSAVAWAELGG